MMLDPASAPVAAGAVQAEDFYREAHRRIFRAALAVADDGAGLDWLTLAGELERRGELEAVGGKDYLADLVDGYVGAANVAAHAAAVRRAAEKRRLIERLSAAVAQAWEPGSDPAAVAAVAMAALTETAEGAGRERGFRFLTLDDIEAMPPMTWLVPDLVPEGALVECHGPPGCGKSFLMLDLALCVAHGRPFFGRPVRQGPTVYVAAGEGAPGMRERIRAWRTRHGVTQAAPFYLVIRPVHLLDEASLALFVAGLCQLPTGKPVLTVLDTLARSMTGGDENSTQDMGRAVTAADLIRERTAGAAAFVHHTRVDGDRERGNTALRGAVDTMLAVKGEDGQMTVTCEKQKDAAPFPEIRLTLEQEGASLVLERAGAEREDGPLTPKQLATLRALDLSNAGKPAASTAWQKCALGQGVGESTWYAYRTKLIRRGMVEEIPVQGSKYTVNRITDSGRLSLILDGDEPNANRPALNGSKSDSKSMGGGMGTPLKGVPYHPGSLNGSKSDSKADSSKSSSNSKAHSTGGCGIDVGPGLEPWPGDDAA